MPTKQNLRKAIAQKLGLPTDIQKSPTLEFHYQFLTSEIPSEKPKVNPAYWYHAEEHYKILELTFQGRNDIKVVAPTVLNQVDFVIAEAFDSRFQGKLLIPINLGGNHWTGLAVEINAGEITGFTYSDPASDSIPVEIKKIIENLKTNYSKKIKLSDKAKIIPANLYKQSDGSSCGPITIENLKKLADKKSDEKFQTTKIPYGAQEFRQNYFELLRAHLIPQAYDKIYQQQLSNTSDIRSYPENKSLVITSEEEEVVNKILGIVGNDQELKAELIKVFYLNDEDKYKEKVIEGLNNLLGKDNFVERMSGITPLIFATVEHLIVSQETLRIIGFKLKGEKVTFEVLKINKSTNRYDGNLISKIDKVISEIFQDKENRKAIKEKFYKWEISAQAKHLFLKTFLEEQLQDEKILNNENDTLENIKRKIEENEIVKRAESELDASLKKSHNTFQSLNQVFDKIKSDWLVYQEYLFQKQQKNPQNQGVSEKIGIVTQVCGIFEAPDAKQDILKTLKEISDLIGNKDNKNKIELALADDSSFFSKLGKTEISGKKLLTDTQNTLKPFEKYLKEGTNMTKKTKPEERTGGQPVSTENHFNSFSSINFGSEGAILIDSKLCQTPAPSTSGGTPPSELIADIPPTPNKNLGESRDNGTHSPGKSIPHSASAASDLDIDTKYWEGTGLNSFQDDIFEESDYLVGFVRFQEYERKVNEQKSNFLEQLPDEEIVSAIIKNHRKFFPQAVSELPKEFFDTSFEDAIQLYNKLKLENDPAKALGLEITLTQEELIWKFQVIYNRNKFLKQFPVHEEYVNWIIENHRANFPDLWEQKNKLFFDTLFLDEISSFEQLKSETKRAGRSLSPEELIREWQIICKKSTLRKRISIDEKYVNEIVENHKVNFPDLWKAKSDKFFNTLLLVELKLFDKLEKENNQLPQAKKLSVSELVNAWKYIYEKLYKSSIQGHDNLEEDVKWYFAERKTFITSNQIEFTSLKFPNATVKLQLENYLIHQSELYWKKEVEASIEKANREYKEAQKDKASNESKIGELNRAQYPDPAALRGHLEDNPDYVTRNQQHSQPVQKPEEQPKLENKQISKEILLSQLVNWIKSYKEFQANKEFESCARLVAESIYQRHSEKFTQEFKFEDVERWIKEDLCSDILQANPISIEQPNQSVSWNGIYYYWKRYLEFSSKRIELVEIANNDAYIKSLGILRKEVDAQQQNECDQKRVECERRQQALKQELKINEGITLEKLLDNTFDWILNGDKNSESDKHFEEKIKNFRDGLEQEIKSVYDKICQHAKLVHDERQKEKVNKTPLEKKRIDNKFSEEEKSEAVANSSEKIPCENISNYSDLIIDRESFTNWVNQHIKNAENRKIVLDQYNKQLAEKATSGTLFSQSTLLEQVSNPEIIRREKALVNAILDKLEQKINEHKEFRSNEGFRSCSRLIAYSIYQRHFEKFTQITEWKEVEKWIEEDSGLDLIERKEISIEKPNRSVSWDNMYWYWKRYKDLSSKSMELVEFEGISNLLDQYKKLLGEFEAEIKKLDGKRLLFASLKDRKFHLVEAQKSLKKCQETPHANYTRQKVLKANIESLDQEIHKKEQEIEKQGLSHVTLEYVSQELQKVKQQKETLEKKITESIEKQDELKKALNLKSTVTTSQIVSNMLSRILNSDNGLDELIRKRLLRNLKSKLLDNWVKLLRDRANNFILKFNNDFDAKTAESVYKNHQIPEQEKEKRRDKVRLFVRKHISDEVTVRENALKFCKEYIEKGYPDFKKTLNDKIQSGEFKDYIAQYDLFKRYLKSTKTYLIACKTALKSDSELQDLENKKKLREELLSKNNERLIAEAEKDEKAINAIQLEINAINYELNFKSPKSSQYFQDENDQRMLLSFKIQEHKILSDEEAFVSDAIAILSDENKTCEARMAEVNAKIAGNPNRHIRKQLGLLQKFFDDWMEYRNQLQSEIAILELIKGQGIQDCISSYEIPWKEEYQTTPQLVVEDVRELLKNRLNDKVEKLVNELLSIQRDHLDAENEIEKSKIHEILKRYELKSIPDIHDKIVLYREGPIKKTELNNLVRQLLKNKNQSDIELLQSRINNLLSDSQKEELKTLKSKHQFACETLELLSSNNASVRGRLFALRNKIFAKSNIEMMSTIRKDSIGSRILNFFYSIFKKATKWARTEDGKTLESADWTRGGKLLQNTWRDLRGAIAKDAAVDNSSVQAQQAQADNSRINKPIYRSILVANSGETTVKEFGSGTINVMGKEFQPASLNIQDKRFATILKYFAHSKGGFLSLIVDDVKKQVPADYGKNQDYEHSVDFQTSDNGTLKMVSKLILKEKANPSSLFFGLSNNGGNVSTHSTTLSFSINIAIENNSLTFKLINTPTVTDIDGGVKEKSAQIENLVKDMKKDQNIAVIANLDDELAAIKFAENLQKQSLQNKP